MCPTTCHPVIVFLLLGVIQLGMSFKVINETGKQTWTCPEKWTAFTAKDDIYCVTPGPSEERITAAHKACVDRQASLVSIHSKEKDQFMQDMMRKFKYNSVLIGLTVIPDVTYYNLLWLRRDGNEMLDYRNFLYDPTLDGNILCTWKRELDGKWFVKSCSGYSVYPFLCEKRPDCKLGMFGRRCEKECHCHGHPCDPQDLTGHCPFGCKRGWMGTGCDKRKENADVTYYCINSNDHGTYASVMIDTKGMNYRNIHGLNAQGKPAPWCKDTAMVIGRPKGFVNLQFFKTNASQEDIAEGKCAGKVIDEDTNQWTIVIQERNGILMDNDQTIVMSCNFSDADTLKREDIDEIREEIETPVVNLQKTNEDVKLEMVDAFNNTVLIGTETGSPVRLQIRFGLQPGSLVKGVIPYNCDASSDDGKQRQPLLDGHGCPVSDLVSSFHKSNVSRHVIQTGWFPAFGFEGSPFIKLHCSFVFCFEDCEPTTGCRSLRQTSRHRSRRDTDSQRTEQHSYIVRRVEILAPATGGKSDSYP